MMAAAAAPLAMVTHGSRRAAMRRSSPWRGSCRRRYLLRLPHIHPFFQSSHGRHPPSVPIRRHPEGRPRVCEDGVSKDDGGRCGAARTGGPWFETRRYAALL